MPVPRNRRFTMSATQMDIGARPIVEIRLETGGHLVPFITGVLISAITAVVSILITGLPHAV
jgi:hypothetical protein